MSNIFLPTEIESSANLPDEIAKELEVLSGFNADSNPINVEFPPDSNQASALQDYNATSTKNPSRISTLCIKYNIICEFESNEPFIPKFYQIKQLQAITL